MHVQSTSNVEARVPRCTAPLDIFRAMNGSVRRLSHLRRYSSFKAIWEENVAEHSFYVGFVAWLVAADINQRSFLDESLLDEELDLGLVAQMALFHDIEEALTGDIITIFKNSSPELKREIKVASKACAEVMIGEYERVGDRIRHIRYLESTELNEAQVVKFADLLCVVMYARDEVRAGNDAFLPVIRDIHRDMVNAYGGNELFGTYVSQIWPIGCEDASVALRDVATVHNSDLYPKKLPVERFGAYPGEGTCEQTSDGLHVWTSEGDDIALFCYACDKEHPNKAAAKGEL